jgi:hypothetical protein
MSTVLVPVVQYPSTSTGTGNDSTSRAVVLGGQDHIITQYWY